MKNLHDKIVRQILLGNLISVGTFLGIPVFLWFANYLIAGIYIYLLGMVIESLCLLAIWWLLSIIVTLILLVAKATYGGRQTPIN